MKGRKVTMLMVMLILLEWTPSAVYTGFAAEKKASEPLGASNVVSELPSEIVGERANELMLRINKAAKDVERYKNDLLKANTEDRLVLQLQLSTLVQRVMNDIHLLADTLMELEKKGKQPDLRKQVEGLFIPIVPQLWSIIDRLRDEVDSARAGRPKAAVEELSAIEDEVRKFSMRLNTIYEMSFAHLKKMEQVGMDIKIAREDFFKRLAYRADKLSGRLNLALDRIENFEARLKETPEDKNIAILLIASKKSLDTNTLSIEVVLGIMEEFELNTTVYREQLLTVTRDIGSGLFNRKVVVNLIGRTLRSVSDWFVDKGPQYFIKLLILFCILYVSRFAMRMVRVGLEKAIDSSNVNLSQLARRMIVTTAANLVMLFGILVALSQLGIRLGPLLAGLGVAGFIVGFALQDTLGNFASGMMILLYRPYDIDDLIDVCGAYGTVNKMSLVSTSLLTLDNQSIVVPNSKIWGDVIKNVTAQDIRRVDMVFGVSYSDDIPKTESILYDILKSHDKILDNPEPNVRVHALGESSVDFIVRPWVKVEDYWDVYWDVTKIVKMRFDEEGVSIPFPQRDLHIRSVEGSSSLTQMTVKAQSPGESPGHSDG
jgi:small conductance mechanosensitive channel